MAVMIYRAGDLHNSPPSRGRPGKRGKLNVGKSCFYETIEPKLEKVKLSAHAYGYTDRSVAKVIAEGIAEASAERDCKPPSRRRRRITESNTATV